MEQLKVFLDESELPGEWYNLMADLPVQGEPPLNPGTQQPIGPEDLAAIFPMSLIAQEVSGDQFIPIPDEIRDVLRLWRPKLLQRGFYVVLVSPLCYSKLWKRTGCGEEVY